MGVKRKGGMREKRTPVHWTHLQEDEAFHKFKTYPLLKQDFASEQRKWVHTQMEDNVKLVVFC